MEKYSNTVPAGFGEQFSSTQLRSLNPRLYLYIGRFKNPKFMVAKPEMVAKPKVAKPSGHYIPILTFFRGYTFA